MKSTFFLNLLFFLLMSLCFGGCSNEEDNPAVIPAEIPEVPEHADNDEISEPVFEIYSLYGSSCHWINREHNGNVIIINSADELNKYVACSGGDYHSIDFSKYSLLLAGGVASSGIYDIHAESMQHLSSNQYVLNVVVSLNEIPEPLEWDMAIRMDKLSKNAGIELKINELTADSTSIAGKWKLLKELPGMTELPVSEIDYSQHNIVYEFKANGVLTVSGNTNVGFPGTGEYAYSIGNYGEIHIDAVRFWYRFSSNKEELIIDSRPIDGPAYYFVKI